MKKSELKEMIKASFLAEAEDSKKGNKEEQKRMEGAIRDDRDHIKNLEKDIKDNEAKLSKLKKDEPKDVSEEMKKDDVDEAMRGSYEEDDTMREAEEVDVEDNEDINVDIEDEVNIDDESEESKIEVDSELAGEDSDISAILGLLTKAQSNAKDLGDEKLMDQIGNTITYYTRTHVVAEEMEDDMDEAMRGDMDEEMKKDDMDETIKLDESLSRFAKLAGLK
tara:strand:- start:380 stop:1045 length:666 start_codon:yes stop_codon:yes gene_type:complete